MQFKVGQRVRIARSVSCPQLVGLEATITSPLVDASNPLFGNWKGHYLEIDGYGLYGFWPGGVCMPPEQLEPITGPDEREVIRESGAELLNRLAGSPDFRIPAPPAQVVTHGDGA